MERYSVITQKNRREIVLLRGSGCAYRRCAFCDYHLDCCTDERENFRLNKSVLDRVKGEFGNLEIINSGSVFELDGDTLDYIKTVCAARGVRTLHFEAHFMYRDKIDALRKLFDGFDLKMKLGLETYDYDLRERTLKKGIPERDPKAIARNFDEANFLFGLTGQSADTMIYDIETGLENFERICVNIMCENSTAVLPDMSVIDEFMSAVYPLYIDNPRVDILINNTDFGVGD